MEKMGKTRADMQRNLKALKSHLSSLNDPGHKGVKKDHDSKMPKDVAATKKKIIEAKMRLDKHVRAMELKEENKTVPLGTSKVNYMDPRITVAWCKTVDLAIEKVFPRTVRTKFPWAMHFPSTYQFD